MMVVGDSKATWQWQESRSGIGFEKRHAAVFATDYGKDELGYTSK